MDDTELAKRVAGGLGGPDLWALRRVTATATLSGLTVVGRSTAAHGASLAREGESTLAMGRVLQMGGELGFAAARMLSGREHYAGAALLRQITEVEHLTWTFKETDGSARAWLLSTRAERKKMFAPWKLRQDSKGRFLDEDYRTHCEEGGHPVPRGIALLGGSDGRRGQLLLVDLLLHSWRTWDQFVAWQGKLDTRQRFPMPPLAEQISPRLAEWGKRDPLYALSVETQPAPK
jgi:hypothetical protein